MELDAPKAKADEDEDDGGFTMDFSIEIVDDINAQIEEMMRLSWLGYFNQARQISDSIAPIHHSKFEVVVEQLRLLMDQGAYEDLIAKAESVSRSDWTAPQSSILDLMRAISYICIDDFKGASSIDSVVIHNIDPEATSLQLKAKLKSEEWIVEEVREGFPRHRLLLIVRSYSWMFSSYACGTFEKSMNMDICSSSTVHSVNVLSTRFSCFSMKNTIGVLMLSFQCAVSQNGYLRTLVLSHIHP
jgi:hypothetical protein